MSDIQSQQAGGKGETKADGSATKARQWGKIRSVI